MVLEQGLRPPPLAGIFLPQVFPGSADSNDVSGVMTRAECAGLRLGLTE